MVRLIILDPNTMKLHAIGSVTGSGTSFFPQRIFQRIILNIMKWIMNKYHSRMDVEIFNLIGREFKSSNITFAVPPNLIPLNQIMIPLIILTNIYEPNKQHLHQSIHSSINNSPEHRENSGWTIPVNNNTCR